MPESESSLELERIAGLVSESSDGIGIDQLCHVLAPLAKRTLQRRLSALVANGRLFTRGAGRALKYVSMAPAINAHLVMQEPPDYLHALGEVHVPLSPEGLQIQAYVRQARHRRAPVSYQVSFLEQYIPKQTAYLPPELRAQLRDMGRSPVDDRPAGTFARDILSRLLIDLSWASSRLEGNTYSLLDTKRLIESGQAAAGKDALETQMILNHKDAIEYLVRDPELAGLNSNTIISLHAFLSDGLIEDPLACGCLRRRAVGIGGSVYLPVAFPQRVEELFDIVIQMASEIVDPFEQSFFLMVHLPYLQPFEDMNKRVSRLAANIPFIRHNLCPLSFIDVPQQAYVDAILGVYELNRIELLRDVFVWAYERSCQQYLGVVQNLVPPDIFRLRYRQALSETIAAIVRNDQAASDVSVSAWLPASVSVVDQTHFIELVLAEFKSLHAGNAIRFGIRPLEFKGWHERHGPGRQP